MKGAKFDCSQKSRESHENNCVPIRVSSEAFRKFNEAMTAYWDHVVMLYGSPRRLRLERRLNFKLRKSRKTTH
ncbi:MAG: hypothetical protein ACUVQG_09205 [Thermogutta sp.]